MIHIYTQVELSYAFNFLYCEKSRFGEQQNTSLVESLNRKVYQDV